MIIAPILPFFSDNAPVYLSNPASEKGILGPDAPEGRLEVRLLAAALSQV